MKPIFATLKEEHIIPNVNLFSDFLENKLNEGGLNKKCNFNIT